MYVIAFVLTYKTLQATELCKFTVMVNFGNTWILFTLLFLCYQPIFPELLHVRLVPETSPLNFWELLS